MPEAVAGWVVGVRVARPARLGDGLLADRIVTVSDCFLPDAVLPEFTAWFDDRSGAEAVRARHAPEAPLLAVTFPARTAAEIAREFPGPVLPAGGVEPLPVDADLLGFEVVGFDGTTAHSWHCHDLVGDASTAVGVRPRPDGMLPGEAEALAVVEWMSALPANDAPTTALWTVVAVHELPA